MSEIPGSAPADATLNAPAKPNENLPTWARVGRWAARYGEGVQPPSLRVAGSPTAKAVGYKRAWDDDRNEVPLNECVEVERLLRRKRAGKAWPFALDKRLATARPPSPELQQRLVGARWKLRGPRLELFCWIIHGNALPVWPDGVRKKSRGLRAKQRQLGELLGSELAPPLDERQVRDHLHDLRRWGLVYARHSFKPYGAVTSQREHVYRVTKLAIDTFGLGDVLDRDGAPDPEEGLAPRAPRIARARQTGGNMPPTPETKSVQKSVAVQTESSAHIHSADLAVSSSSIPSSETLHVIASEPCGSTESSTPTDGLRPLSAAPTRFGESAAPDASPDATHGEATSTSSNPVGPLCERGGASAADRLGDLVPNVRRGDVEYRRPAIDRGSPVDEDEQLERHRRRSAARKRRRERREDMARRRELERQVDELAERDAGERTPLVDDVPPPSDVDAPSDVGWGESPPDESVEEARRRERERYKREQDEFSHVQSPVRRRDDADDNLEFIEHTKKNWEATRFMKRHGRGRRDGGDS